MLISVDFWKSIHGFAMDSRTREVTYILLISIKWVIIVVYESTKNQSVCRSPLCYLFWWGSGHFEEEEKNKRDSGYPRDTWIDQLKWEVRRGSIKLSRHAVQRDHFRRFKFLCFYGIISSRHWRRRMCVCISTFVREWETRSRWRHWHRWEVSFSFYPSAEK